MSDEDEIKSEIESISEKDDKIKELKKKKEEKDDWKSEVSKIMESDVKVEEVRNKLLSLEEDSRPSKKAGIEPYDPLKYGPLIKDESIEGGEEVDKYWVEKPYSLVKIAQMEESGEYKYHLLEPQLSEEEWTEKEIIWNELKSRLPFNKIEGDKEIVLGDKFSEIIQDRELQDFKRIHRILYYLVKDNLGFGKIDGLMRDERIEDISCDGVDIPLYIYHRDYYNLKTNIKFEEERLNTFVNRLAGMSGSHISYADPVVETTLPGGSRLQASLGSEVTTKGSSFTIRKFGGESFTPVDLIRYGTYGVEMLANIWMAIENGKSIMVVGGTASGKTSTLNAFAFFIPPDAKIVSIEDTRELSLYQGNWLPNLTRESGEGEKLDMHELVRKAMRQRPECIIVGEVRGEEALAMFQAISTGHIGFSTMHAGSVQDAVNRLVGEPINLPKPMLAELDIMCLQLITNLEDKRVRRNSKVVEFLGLDSDTKKLKISENFSWDRNNDSYKKRSDSQILKEIREEKGMSIPEMNEEIEKRSKLLRGMVEKSIYSYGEIASLIRQYYFDSEKALEKVS